MNKKLELVEKAVEIFGVSVEIERMNEEMVKLIFTDTPHNGQLTELQDKLFGKRVELTALEKEYKGIKNKSGINF